MYLEWICMHTKCTFICTYVQKYTHSTLMSSSSFVLAIRLQEVVKSRKQTIIMDKFTSAKTAKIACIPLEDHRNRENRVHCENIVCCSKNWNRKRKEILVGSTKSVYKDTHAWRDFFFCTSGYCVLVNNELISKVVFNAKDLW